MGLMVGCATMISVAICGLVVVALFIQSPLAVGLALLLLALVVVWPLRRRPSEDPSQ